ncbi:MAG: transglutaminase domain-containing protein [Bacteroidota bacterium]
MFKVLSQNKTTTEKWLFHKGNLKNVFVNSNHNNLEILRLYDDEYYEYLLYRYTFTDKSYCTVKRDVGTYSLKGKHLSLHKPKRKNIFSKSYLNEYVYIAKRGIYSSTIKSIVNKSKPIMKNEKTEDYSMAFYIDPKTNIIVNNQGAEKKIDLKDLAVTLTRFCKTEKEKVNCLIKFIHNSIDYDHVGYVTGKYAHHQKNTVDILASAKRIANCQGFSYALEVLCKNIDIECKEVDGYVKVTKINPALKGEYHAWNKVRVDGKEELHDITWADNGSFKWINVDPELMIHSHFPDKIEDQLTEHPITMDEFISRPILYPESAKNQYLNFFPKAGTNFCDSVFCVTLNGKAENVSVYELINSSTSSFYSYSQERIAHVSVSMQDDKTTIKIPLSKTETVIEICTNGISLTYRVVKGTREDLYTHYIKNLKKKDVNSYVKAIVSSILMNDEKKLIELVGEDNNVFWDKNKKLNQKFIKLFNNWDGSINKSQSEYVMSVQITSDMKSTRTTSKWELVNKVYLGKNYLNWKETDKGFQIVSAN